MPRLTLEQKRMARRLSNEGLSLREVARQVSCSHEAVRWALDDKAQHPAKPHIWEPATGRLTLADREEVSLGLQRGDTFSAIAAGLGRATSTVSREVAGNGGRGDYRAWRAHERARRGSVAVISPVTLRGSLVEAVGDLETQISVLTPEEAKGLEFDVVVVVEPFDIAGRTQAGLRSLYICLTRATKELIVLHSKPLPIELRPKPAVGVAGHLSEAPK